MPTILLMRDSYAGMQDRYTGNNTFWCKYLPQHFGKTIFIRSRNIKNFDSYVSYFKPDIVVFEFYKGNLRQLADLFSQLKGTCWF